MNVDPWTDRVSVARLVARSELLRWVVAVIVAGAPCERFLGPEPSTASTDTLALACVGPRCVALTHGSAVTTWDMAQRRVLARRPFAEPVLDLHFDASSDTLLALTSDGRMADVAFLHPGTLRTERSTHLPWPATRILGTRRADGALLLCEEEGVEVVSHAGVWIESFPWPDGCAPRSGTLTSDGERLLAAFTDGTLDDFVRLQVRTLDLRRGVWERAEPAIFHKPRGDAPWPLRWVPDHDLAVGFRPTDCPYLELRELEPAPDREAVRRFPLDQWEFPTFALSPGAETIACALPSRHVPETPHLGRLVGGYLRIVDASSGRGLGERDALRLAPGDPDRTLRKLGQELAFVGDGRLVSIDATETGRLRLTLRDVPSLSPLRGVPLPDIDKPVFLASSRRWVLVAWRGVRAEARDPETLAVRRTWDLTPASGIGSEAYAIDDEGRVAMVDDEGGVWLADGASARPRRVADWPAAAGWCELLHLAAGRLRGWAREGDADEGPIHPWTLDLATGAWHKGAGMLGGDSFLFATDADGRGLVRFGRGPDRGELVAWRPSEGEILWRAPVEHRTVRTLELSPAGVLFVAFEGAPALVRFDARTGQRLDPRHAWPR